MGRIKKKGTSGNAKNFITRTQAIKRLQVSLADFRRLCIFKGIYPREPRNKKKANKGSTKPVTFYYFKDIQYLLHEPILNKFRQHKTFAKKLNKLISKNEVGDAKRLNSAQTGLKLDHIIKERYPTFQDALRDLNDPLNMIYLFANMPATDKVSTKVINECKAISNYWMAYVAKEQLMEKVFVSIKGVYFSAKVKGEEIIWLQPFKFPQNIPSDIDFRIMLTFLEFYLNLLKFVLFKLFKDSNLVYPPKANIRNNKLFNGLSNYILELRNDNPADEITNSVNEKAANIKADILNSDELQKALQKDQEVEKKDPQEQEVDEQVETAELDEFDNHNKGNSLYQPKLDSDPFKNLFKNFTFFVGREVNIELLEFLILSFNGKVVSEILIDSLSDKDSELKEKILKSVTHQITDRPKITNKAQGRTYVQPQWIFDCINNHELLFVSNYAPGETLPPHLSPWGDAGGYDPNAKTAQQAEEEMEEAEEEAEEDNEIEGEDEDEDEDEEDNEDELEEDLQAQKELEMEAKGLKYSDVKDEKETKSKKTKKRNADLMTKEEKQAAEEKEMKKIMMSNKQKKLYQKMEYSNKLKDDRVKNLASKKRKIEKIKKKLN